MWVAFANAKATHIFFSKNISIHAIFNNQSFNDTLTNDIVSFEQLGLDVHVQHRPLLDSTAFLGLNWIQLFAYAPKTGFLEVLY